MNRVPSIALNDGRSIPQLGLGVYQIPVGATARAVGDALALGYRHIDTAQGYANERGVGDGVRASGLDRAEVFVTSKLTNSAHRPDAARRAFAGTLSELGFDYIDLFLIHWPVPTRYGGDFASTWKVLEEFQHDGRARSIGVSNFEPDHLERLAGASKVVPCVNQVELQPYFQNREVRVYDEAHGIVTQAWSPLAQGRVLADPVLTSIAAKAGRSPAQVVLRWHIERGHVVIPKSVSAARMRENFELFDWQLEPDDLAAVDALERGESGRDGPHPDTFA
jgi:2,5-diketo-D-gluconate reductase A